MGGGGGNAPQQPFFQPVNIPEAIAQAISYDVQGYNWSDADFTSRFPGLVQTRNEEIGRAYNELTGPLDPTVESSFTNQGLNQGATALGGGDPLSGLGLTAGSAGRNAASVSFANSVMSKEDADRQYFTQLLLDNPQRQFGIGAGDVSGLFALNTQGVNNFNSQSFQSELNNIYTQGQQQAATGAQIAALGNILARLNQGGG